MPMTAQPSLRITVPAIKHRSPKYAALHTLNQSMPPNTGTNTVRFENKSRRRENTLEKTP